MTYVNRPQGATTGAWPGYQAFGGWKGSGSTGKAIGSFYYLPQYMREQSQTRRGVAMAHRRPRATPSREHVRDGQTRRHGGLHAPDPVRRGARDSSGRGGSNLHLVRMTPDLIYDQMIGAGCARAAHLLVGRQPGRRARCTGCATRSRTAGRAPLEIVEHSHAGMAAAYTAGASRPAVRHAARLHRHRPAARQPADPERHLPLHGRGRSPPCPR